MIISVYVPITIIYNPDDPARSGLNETVKHTKNMFVIPYITINTLFLFPEQSMFFLTILFL